MILLLEGLLLELTFSKVTFMDSSDLEYWVPSSEFIRRKKS